jgi:serine/threonine protein kinase
MSELSDPPSDVEFVDIDLDLTHPIFYDFHKVREILDERNAEACPFKLGEPLSFGGGCSTMYAVVDRAVEAMVVSALVAKVVDEGGDELKLLKAEIYFLDLLQRRCYDVIVGLSGAYRHDRAPPTNHNTWGVIMRKYAGDLSDFADALLADSKPVAEVQVWAMLLQMARTLVLTHDGDGPGKNASVLPEGEKTWRPIVHRDIKSENILVHDLDAPIVRLKLADFGGAMFEQPATDHERRAVREEGDYDTWLMENSGMAPRSAYSCPHCNNNWEYHARLEKRPIVIDFGDQIPYDSGKSPSIWSTPPDTDSNKDEDGDSPMENADPVLYQIPGAYIPSPASSLANNPPSSHNDSETQSTFARNSSMATSNGGEGPSNYGGEPMASGGGETTSSSDDESMASSSSGETIPLNSDDPPAEWMMHAIDQPPKDKGKGPAAPLSDPDKFDPFKRNPMDEHQFFLGIQPPEFPDVLPAGDIWALGLTATTLCTFNVRRLCPCRIQELAVAPKDRVAFADDYATEPWAGVYSRPLCDVIMYMMQVTPEMRPTARELAVWAERGLRIARDRPTTTEKERNGIDALLLEPENAILEAKINEAREVNYQAEKAKLQAEKAKAKKTTLPAMGTMYKTTSK